MRLHDQELILNPDRTVFWPAQNALLLADTHFGKTSHFQKNGVPISDQLFNSDIERLRQRVLLTQPKMLYILGDLFHANWNNQWNEVAAIFRSFVSGGTKVLLIRGNHDFLAHQDYEQANIEVADSLEIGCFTLVHDPDTPVSAGQTRICGHLHPAVRLHGSAKQSMRFPCFYANEQNFILPAFGKFTGMKTIKISRKDQVYIIHRERVIHLETSKTKRK